MSIYTVFALHAVERNREVRRQQRLYQESQPGWKPLVAHNMRDVRNQAQYYRRLLCDPRSFTRLRREPLGQPEPKP
jgi:hypothetical protein